MAKIESIYPPLYVVLGCEGRRALHGSPILAAPSGILIQPYAGDVRTMTSNQSRPHLDIDPLRGV